jgi:alcohol dehydrogenase class IV
VWVKNLCQTLQVESLAHLGLNRADLPAVVAKSQISSSMQGNPIQLTEAELLEILNQAL